MTGNVVIDRIRRPRTPPSAAPEG